MKGVTQIMNKEKDDSKLTVQVSEIQTVSPNNRAIYEAGKKMLIDSVETGRNFCQFMITTSTSAISVYLALLIFLFPKDYSLGPLRGALVAGPAILFLVGALLFAFGYFPATASFSLDIIDEIEKARRDNINRRNNLATIGFGFFVVAILYAVAVVILNIGAR